MESNLWGGKSKNRLRKLVEVRSKKKKKGGEERKKRGEVDSLWAGW